MHATSRRNLGSLRTVSQFFDTDKTFFVPAYSPPNRAEAWGIAFDF
jgi:hypothetical protein